jgi:cytochrome c553
VPPGSIARGQAIASNGGGGISLPCTACHGPTLQGVGLVPRLAGRSPTYLLRALVAFKTNARSGISGAPMKPVVAGMDIGSMIDAAAYAASLPP